MIIHLCEHYHLTPDQVLDMSLEQMRMLAIGGEEYEKRYLWKRMTSFARKISQQVGFYDGEQHS